jgi:hypothetical protein
MLQGRVVYKRANGCKCIKSGLNVGDIVQGHYNTTYTGTYTVRLSSAAPVVSAAMKTIYLSYF